MVLLNLCDTHLKTTVKCDKPSDDDHDINNLLLNNDKGFLVYPCIKPPINVDFNFPKNIQLSHIVIWPSVGAQKSTSFKIAVKDDNLNSSYCQISSVDLAETDNGAIFYSNYNAKQLTKKYENFAIKPINNHLKVIKSVKSLRLTITRTNKSICALKRVEIWGHVSYNLLKQSLSDIAVNSKANNELKTNVEMEKETSEIINGIPAAKESLKIPEEYLDPITCSMMIQPIVLPSGKVIDYSTLEKFGANEAVWGRPLRDPFTGIPFSENYKPVFADTIKCQIDKFISQNSEFKEFLKLPRLLGPFRMNYAINQQLNNRIVKLPGTERHRTENKNSASSTRTSHGSEISDKSEDNRFKHRMPIDAKRFGELLRGQRKNINVKRLNK